MALFFTSEEFRNKIKWPLAGWTSVEDPSQMSSELLDLRNDTSASQTGCLAFDNIAAVGAAAKVINDIGQDNISNKIIEISSYLVSKLKELPVEILSYTNRVESCSGTINIIFNSDNITVGDVVKELHTKKIYVNDRKGTMRISVHFYNTQIEIDHFVKTLGSIL